jgi:hypothetical protein
MRLRRTWTIVKMRIRPHTFLSVIERGTPYDSEAEWIDVERVFGFS